MKWRRRPEPDPQMQPHDPGIDEAHEALEAAMSRWPEVNEVTEQIRGIRRRNHLAEITERALRGTQ